MIKYQRKKHLGAALLEFVLILPLTILMFTGIVEITVLHYNKYILLNACREGARYGINYTNSTYPSEAQISSYTSNLLSNKLLSMTTSYASPVITVSSSTRTPAPGSTLTVSATYLYSDYILHNFLNSSPQYNLNASVTMVYQ